MLPVIIINTGFCQLKDIFWVIYILKPRIRAQVDHSIKNGCITELSMAEPWNYNGLGN
jgi:hypothetical protein